VVSLRAVVLYANDRGVTIVSDEVYEHFVYEKKHVSAGRFGEDVITVNAVSKTYAMTGWRIGYIAAPEDYIPECLKVHQYIQACATSISQYAALAAYTGDQGPVARMRDEYRARRDLLYDGLSGIRFNFPRPEGAFYMFVPMGRNIIEKAIEAGVIIVPGEAFGSRAPDYARISYATSRENLSRAVERLAALVE
jgi:aspartate aminotransferase